MRLVDVMGEGLVAAERVVAVAQLEAAPVRRMVRAAPPDRVVVMTGGRKRLTAVVLDSGHVIITALELADWKKLLGFQPTLGESAWRFCGEMEVQDGSPGLEG